MTETNSNLEPSARSKDEPEAGSPEQAAEDQPQAPEAPTAESATEQDAEPAAEQDAEPAAEQDAEPAAEQVAEPAAAETSPEKTERGEPRASRARMSRSRQTRLASLYRAYRSGRPIEGSVEGVIKGGYEIKLGKIRAFCPHSQIDLQRIEQPESLVGQRYLFRITQLRRGGEDIVVSRRVVLEEERLEEAKAVRATLIEGAVMQGRVAGLADFGAFVDLGAGVMGLVHVSELSHARISKVSDAVKVGDVVPVKILKFDESNQRISLSVRQAEKDPWSDVAERFEVGRTYPGTVKRLTDFGAFVELAAGVEALAPASEFPPSREGWRDQIQPGTSRDWLVLSVDPKLHRISITPPFEGVDLASLPPLEVGGCLKGRVQRIEKFGVFVWLGPGRVGLMPNAWTGTQRGEDLARRFPIGEEIEVDVVELTDGGRKIRLAKKGVTPEAPSHPPGGGRRRPGSGRREPRDREPRGVVGTSSDGDSPFGTILADKLKAALGKSDEDS